MSYSQTPSLNKTGVLASPPELLNSLDRFPSPTPSNTNTGRCSFQTPMSGIQLTTPIDKMSIAAATNPTPMTMLSPPPSPAIRRLPSPSISVSSPPSSKIADRVLFPQAEHTISLETPLFDVSEQFEPLIQNVISTSNKTKRKVDSRPKPTDEEYNAFVSCAWRLYQSNPRDWLRREKANMKIMDRAGGNKVQKATATAGYTKRNIAPARSANTGASAPKPRVQARSARTPRPTPKAAIIDSFAYPDGRFPTPQTPSSGPIRIRAVATREDADFEAIPDMSPPIETLPGSKCLKADWKGTVLDLADDPHANLLHPAELHLASVLRLSCASYLTSKRRIFQMKVERERMGLKFMKTDSQKACKIDVNKASKLWTAYEKVGWFEKRYIQQYL